MSIMRKLIPCRKVNNFFLNMINHINIEYCTLVSLKKDIGNLSFSEIKPCQYYKLLDKYLHHDHFLICSSINHLKQ